MRARFLWRALRARYRDQRAELGAILSVLRPGDTAVDVGANKGSYTYWLSRAAGPGRVVAFEPQQELADYLRLAARVLPMRNLTVESRGVSGRSGTLALHVPGSGPSPGASFEMAVAAHASCHHVEVPVVALDEYFGPDEPIRVVKVDVEGHEPEVFRGAQRILERDGPLLVFECEQRHLSTGTVRDVLDYLRGFGYDGHFVHRSGLAPLSAFRPELHQRAGPGPFRRDQDYSNNFILRRG